MPLKPNPKPGKRVRRGVFSITEHPVVGFNARENVVTGDRSNRIEIEIDINHKSDCETY